MEAIPKGTVTLDGDWLDVRFLHDRSVVGLLKKIGGRRMEFGHWRVPADQASRLAKELAPHSFEWDGRAASLQEGALAEERRLRREDALALRVKAGLTDSNAWDSPVPLFGHQRLAVDFLVSRSAALLCDEQGLGKT